LYTRCPECRTIFVVTATELRAADGQVVCGHCDDQFNALDSLSETLPAAEDEDQVQGPDAEEDSVFADIDAPHDVGPTADARAMRADPDREAVHETDAPTAADTVRDEDEFLREVESLIDEEDPELPDPDDVFRVEGPPEGNQFGHFILTDAGGAHEPVPPESREGAQPDSSVAAEPVEAAATEVATRPVETARPAAAPAAADGHDAPPFVAFGDDEPPASRRRLRIGIAAFALLVALLAGSHMQRGRLLRHPLGEAVLGTVYGWFGAEVAPDWSPESFRVLRSSAVSDPESARTLVVTAEFRNDAGFAQPYPLLRVALEDRWGERVESRDFRPAQYRDGHVSGRRMAVGERVQATVSLPDPGARADGFRVDLCLETEAQGLVCATDSRP
jgi:predicted Zn finger-like uncharacterized protein